MANKVIEIACQQTVEKANGTKTPPKDLPRDQPYELRRNPRRSTRSSKASAQELPKFPSLIPLSDDDVAHITDSKVKDTFHIIIQVPLKVLDAPFNQSTRLDSKDPDAIIEISYDETSNWLQVSMGLDVAAQRLYSVSGNVIWVAEQVEIRNIKQSYKKLSRQLVVLARHKHKEQISDLFFVLTVQPKFVESTQYMGLINKGSTCYMNSFLQMLNHFTALRNLVYRMKKIEPDKFPGTLQNLFYRLATEKKAVSTDELLKSYGWTREENFVQQDVQEFSCLFFQVLERKINEQPELKGGFNRLIEGELTNYITCVDVGKLASYTDYHNEFNEKFIQLQLQVSGYSNLEDSLASYLNYQVLEGDNMYRTEDHGLQVARKGLRIASVGPVLMIQLKRFQFNFETEINQKILDRFEYPDTLPLGILLKLPEVPAYRLYAVLVHSGERASSGHYYAYIKIQEKWYKFNDEKVTEACEKEVFQYNFGGETATKFILDQRQLVLKETEEVIASTAYMLVYYNSQLEDKIFKEQLDIPEWIRERISKKTEMVEETHNNLVSVKVIRWENIESQPVTGKGLVNMNEWSNLPEMQIEHDCLLETFIDMFMGHSKGKASIFIFDTARGGQILVSPLQKKSLTISEVFKKSEHPGVLIFENTQSMIIQQEQSSSPIVVIIKLFQALTPVDTFYIFSDYILMPKDSKNADLLQRLECKYLQEAYMCNFSEEREDGNLHPIERNKFLMPKTRSHEVTIIVEKIHFEAKGMSYEKYLKEKGKMIETTIRSEDGKIQKKCEIAKQMEIYGLRKYIFNELLKKSEEYVSAENITIKMKSTRNSKKLTEVHSGNVSNFTKFQNLIIFGFSKMISTQRQNSCTILDFRYRYRSLLLSQNLDMIISKDHRKNVYELLAKNNRIEECLKLEGAQNYRVILLDAGMTRILRLFQQDDEDVFSLWKKQKGSTLAIEAKQSFDSPSYSILCHHKTKSGEYIGSPVVIQLKKAQSMMVLANRVLSLSKQQSYNFDGKVHALNASKITMNLYRIQESASMGIELNHEVDTPLEVMYPDEDYLFLDVTHSYLTKVIKTMKIDV